MAKTKSVPRETKGPGGRPRAWTDPAQLQSEIEGYFQFCEDHGIEIVRGGQKVTVSEPLTVAGMADHLGVSRETVHAYATKNGHQFSDTIKKAITKIERDKVSKAMLGFYDKTIAIFDLKNNHGYKDRSEVIEGTLQDARKMTRADIERELGEE